MSSKKIFSTSINADRLKALKHLAVDRETSLGALLEEAIEDLLKKHQTKKNRKEDTGRSPQVSYMHVADES